MSSSTSSVVKASKIIMSPPILAPGLALASASASSLFVFAHAPSVSSSVSSELARIASREAVPALSAAGKILLKRITGKLKKDEEEKAKRFVLVHGVGALLFVMLIVADITIGLAGSIGLTSLATLAAILAAACYGAVLSGALVMDDQFMWFVLAFVRTVDGLWCTAAAARVAVAPHMGILTPLGVAGEWIFVVALGVCALSTLPAARFVDGWPTGKVIRVLRVPFPFVLGAALGIVALADSAGGLSKLWLKVLVALASGGIRLYLWQPGVLAEAFTHAVVMGAVRAFDRGLPSLAVLFDALAAAWKVAKGMPSLRAVRGISAARAALVLLVAHALWWAPWSLPWTHPLVAAGAAAVCVAELACAWHIFTAVDVDTMRFLLGFSLGSVLENAGVMRTGKVFTTCVNACERFVGVVVTAATRMIQLKESEHEELLTTNIVGQNVAHNGADSVAPSAGELEQEQRLAKLLENAQQSVALNRAKIANE